MIRNPARKRLLVIGLDCAEPSLVFDKLKSRMPVLTTLASKGSYGPLRSTIPPTTIPAWFSMFTGLDPGELGVYGFRNRSGYSYDLPVLATARSVQAPRVWDLLSRAGLTSFVMGVPGTYPPWPIRGRMVSSFLAPDTRCTYTYPPELKRQVESIAQGYMIDVEGFRTENKARLLDEINRMTRKRFRVVREWARESGWDLLVVGEMGPDRLHHGFWRFFDPSHRLHVPGNPFRSAIPDYYELLDAEIGQLIRAAGDGVDVLVISDHGAQSMQGGFRINEWLIAQGDLVLTRQPSEPRKLSPELIDWGQTLAWGEGGYSGKIFLNIDGREPQGSLPATRVREYKRALAARLEQTADESGHLLGTRVYYPEDVYRRVTGFPPDLIVSFGDHAWRCLAEIGTSRVHARGNDTGPDDANHSREGIFIFSEPIGTSERRQEVRSILDVTPLILDLFGLDDSGGYRLV